MAWKGRLPGGLSYEDSFMIRGEVNNTREAVVTLTIRGPNNHEVDVDAVVDTGFTATLTLPRYVVNTLQLIRKKFGSANLADGSIRQFEIYQAEVFWKSDWRPILVSVLGDETLIGMQLIENHELRINVRPGGIVTID